MPFPSIFLFRSLHKFSYIVINMTFDLIFNLKNEILFILKRRNFYIHSSLFLISIDVGLMCSWGFGVYCTYPWACIVVGN